MHSRMYIFIAFVFIVPTNLLQYGGLENWNYKHKHICLRIWIFTVLSVVFLKSVLQHSMKLYCFLWMKFLKFEMDSC